MRIVLLVAVMFATLTVAAPPDFPNDVAELIARACPARCAVFCVCCPFYSLGAEETSSNVR
jgi:hypothetical protein